jgi:hypothetical protein
VELITSYPLWFLIFCFALGAGYAWLLYNKDSRFAETHQWLVRLMTALRFSTVSVLAFFLLSPLIKTQFREIEKPIIIIAADNSASMKFSDTVAYSLKALTQNLNELKTTLSKDFDVRLVGFANAVNENPELTFAEKISDYAALTNDLTAKYTGRNLGAVIIAGDGIYNNGSNPVYAAEKLKVPFYTIALGDTTIKKDLVLTKVNHNRIAFLGNNFPLDVVIDARQCSGANTNLTIQEDSSIVFSRNISVAGNKYHLNIPVVMEAKKKGIHKYRIKLSAVDGEINTINNVADVYIEVLESKQKILLLANAPHPDLSAFKTAIENNLNYEADVKFAESFSGNLSLYQLVVLHQLPSESRSIGTKAILEKVKQSNVPVLYVLGSQTNVGAFNELQLGLTIASNINRNNEVLPYANKNFSLFTVSEEALNYINNFPPLIAPFGTYKPNAEIYTLLQQRIGPVTTDQPMLFFRDNNGSKSAVLCGEGLWKWRLQEFAEKENNSITNELVSKIMQYLLAKEKRSPFRVSNKTDFKENEPLLFDAQLFNAAGDAVNEPDAQITFYSQDKKEYKYTFSKSGKGYALNAGLFPPGSYRYKAETKLGDVNYRDEGEFTVSALQLENVETTANHQLLFAMSERTGGAMIYPQQINSLPDLIKAKEEIRPVSFYRKKLIDFISLKWIFGMLMLLLTAEWFLRKRSGGY